MRPATLVLVRHGQSTGNVEARVQGQTDTPLTDLGHEQAARTAAWLADTYPGAHVVTSDLRRCQDTAKPIVEALGVPAVAEPRLRERAFGAWEDRTHDEIAADWPDLWGRFRHGEDVVAAVGGESTVDLSARAREVFGALLPETADGDPAAVTIAVTHGGTIWNGLHALLGLSPPALGPVGNASVTEVVEPRPGHRVLWSWNQTAHLPDDLRTWFRPARPRPATADA